MTKIHHFIPIILLSISPAAQAAEALVLTFHRVGDHIRTRNPDLLAARHLVDEALGRELQSGRLENPELEFEIEQNENFNEHRIGLGLSQAFPLTHRLKTEQALGATAVMAARSEIRAVENQLIGQAKQAMVRVLVARERARLIERQSGLATELATFLSDAVGRGEASALEASQAKLATMRHATELRRLAAQEQRALGALRPLLGLARDASLVVSGELPGWHDPGDGASGAPAVKVADLAIEAARQQLEIERMKRTEDLTAGMFAASERTIDAPGAAEREWIVGFKLSLPLPWWDRNEGNIQAAEAREKRRLAERVAVERRLTDEADAARSEVAEWMTLMQQIDGQLMPLAEEQTTLAEQAWRDGQGDLASVLRAREQRLDLAAARLDALENYHLAQVRRLTATGGH